MCRLAKYKTGNEHDKEMSQSSTNSKEGHNSVNFVDDMQMR